MWQYNYDYLMHANYKYIKREKKNGKWVYYYKGDNTATNQGMTRKDMADKVIRGEFGNGEQRKELLGDTYGDVQKTVNQKYDDAAYAARDAELKKAQKEAKNVGKYAKATVQRGANGALKLLNKIGKGTVDNAVKKVGKKAKAWLSKIF